MNLAQWQQRALLAAGIGILLLVIGLLFDARAVLQSYLFAYVFWTGVGIGSLGILLLHHTVGGKWGLVIRRPCEAGAATLQYAALLLVPVLIALPSLYPWAMPEAAADPLLEKKAAYLNVPFFVVRSFTYFVIFTWYARALRRWSLRQDTEGTAASTAKMRAVSAPGLVVFTVTATFAFVDWVMSLEPEWFSTLYGLLFLVGQVLSAFALTIAVVILLRDREPLETRLTPQHFHDLGNLLFAFTMLWSYLSFSQFLIIWAGNLPEEIPWYVRRLEGGWGIVALMLVLLHFCVPFLLLLQREVKRRARLLVRISIFLLCMRVVDVYWVIVPAFYGDRVRIHWTAPAAFVAIGGIWLWLFVRELRRYPLMPLRDPQLEGAPKEMVVY